MKSAVWPFQERWRLFSAPWRRVRPTPEGWAFFACSLAVALAATNTGNNLLYLVFGSLLALVGLSGILSEASLRGVELERILPAELVAGESARGVLRVHNRKSRLPIFALDVQEQWSDPSLDGSHCYPSLPYLARGESADLLGRWDFRCRGRAHLWGLRLSTRWPFGILEKSYLLPLPQDAVVFPNPEPGQPLFGVSAAMQGNSASRRPSADGSGFHDLRSYQRGDDPRRIHWRISARRDELMLVRGEAEQGQRVEVLLPQLPLTSEGGAKQATAEETAAYERRISEVAYSIEGLLRDGGEVVFLYPDGRRLGPFSGAVGRLELLRALAVLPVPSRRDQ